MNPAANGNLTFRPEDIDAALRRAAVKARELGQRTQTPVLVLRNGAIVDICNEPATQVEGPRAGPAAP